MLKLNSLLLLVTLLALAATASAQQMETNDPTGSLTIDGVTPVPGAPSVVNIQDDNTFTINIAGDPNAGVILFLALGPVGPTSTLVGGMAGGTEFFDLDASLAIRVLIDGIGGAGALPFFNQTDQNGSLDLPLNANAGLVGLSFSWQAVVADAASPFGLNFTAAEQTDIASFVPPVSVSFTGDDAIQAVPLTAPVTFCGSIFTEVTVSTNGWIRFGSTATSTDFSESTADFINGNVGLGAGPASPAIAVLWEDLDMGNTLTGPLAQSVVVTDDGTGSGGFTVEWVNADYFPTTFLGTVSCTYDPTGGIVTLDYTGYVAVTPPTEGLVGISCGDAMAPVAQVDLVSGGFVTVDAATPGVARTIFQNFDGSGTTAAEAFDLATISPLAQILTFAETPGVGDYTLF